MSYLDRFYKFYQTCESPQKIDISREYVKYLMPDDIDKSQHMKNKIKQIKNYNENFSSRQNLSEYNNWYLRKKIQKVNTIQNIDGPMSSSQLRPVMNRRLKKIVARKRNLQDIILVPDEYFLENSSNEGKKTLMDLAVISKKENVLSLMDNLNAFSSKAACSLASEAKSKFGKAICDVIYDAGFTDNHLSNFILTKDRKKLVLVDTEAQALMCLKGEKIAISTESGIQYSNKNYKPLSLVNARIVGLKEFLYRNEQQKETKCNEFEKIGKYYLKWAQAMKVMQMVLIVLSLICPLVPLSVLIYSVVAEVLFPYPSYEIDNKHIKRNQKIL